MAVVVEDNSIRVNKNDMGGRVLLGVDIEATKNYPRRRIGGGQ